MRKIWLLPLSLLSLNAWAGDYFVLKGSVTDESNKPLTGVEINVGDVKTRTDKAGIFTLKAAKADVYKLKLEKPGFYRSVQHFSHFELSGQTAETNPISPIALVEKRDKRVMLAFTGDAMMGRRYYKPYFSDPVLIREENKLADSKALLAPVKDYLSLADFAVVNLETQIAENEPAERAKKSVTFFSRPETLEALKWAGVDYVSLGNNHTYDYLESGLDSTLKHLAQSGLGYSGADFNEQLALKPYQTIINGVPLSMLGYVGWTGSAIPSQTATTEHGGAAWGNLPNLLSTVGKAAGKGTVPIVQYHGSQEYADGPTGTTEQRLKSSLDAGAALAIAHHPHVVQGLELYQGKLLAYSMGNFVFDQNFPATMHSYILYVWLDGDKFHRAELVPLHVKGYIPTPATGMHRYTVMRRLTELSADRDTYITRSGGHGVITNQNTKPAEDLQITVAFDGSEKSVSLYHLPWQKGISEVQLDDDSKYRLGVNLINGSDFESFESLGAKERGFAFDKQNTRLNDFGYKSQRSLGLSVAGGESHWLAMKSFRRVYLPDQPTTVKFRAQTQDSVKVKVYWQGRKTRQKLFDALDNGKKHLLAEQTLSSSKHWQNIEIDFDSPRIGYRSYRILLEFEAQNGKTTTVNVDDLSLIEWQTAFSSNSKPATDIAKAARASFIGLDKIQKTDVVLTLD